MSEEEILEVFRSLNLTTGEERSAARFESFTAEDPCPYSVFTTESTAPCVTGKEGLQCAYAERNPQ
jgi:hypothetical protein